MFSEMISMLKEGEEIDLNQLRKRFDRALVKKIGVLRTPYSFWTSDPKINPPAKELFWAAILLGDRENCRLVRGIIATELDERSKASGLPHNPADQKAESDRITTRLVSELLDLAPSKEFRKFLTDKVRKSGN